MFKRYYGAGRRYSFVGDDRALDRCDAVSCDREIPMDVAYLQCGTTSPTQESGIDTYCARDRHHEQLHPQTSCKRTNTLLQSMPILLLQRHRPSIYPTHTRPLTYIHSLHTAHIYSLVGGCACSPRARLPSRMYPSKPTSHSPTWHDSTLTGALPSVSPASIVWSRVCCKARGQGVHKRVLYARLYGACGGGG